jgi:hypothetical protein
MEEITGAEGEEDADMEVVMVQGDKEVVPCLQTICVICRGQEDMVAWHLALDICLLQWIHQTSNQATQPPTFQHCEEVCKLECMFFMWIRR